MRPTDYHLREFRDADAEHLRQLLYDTIDRCYRGVYPEEAIEYFKDYHSREHILEDARDGYTVVVEADGRLVATGTLLGANVRRVFVHPSWHRRGLGKLVMQTLENQARRRGLRMLDLSASLVSKRFYDSRGYVTREEGSFPVGDGQELKYFAMAKVLGESGPTVP